MKLEPFKAEHAHEIDLAIPLEGFPPGYFETLAAHMAYTVREGANIVACGGVVQVERDVGVAWSLMSRHAGRKFLALHRIAERLFEVSGLDRILANTDIEGAHGCRWLKALGFRPLEDGLLEGFQQGRDHQLYVRAR